MRQQSPGLGLDKQSLRLSFNKRSKINDQSVKAMVSWLEELSQLTTADAVLMTAPLALHRRTVAKGDVYVRHA